MKRIYLKYEKAKRCGPVVSPIEYDAKYVQNGHVYGSTRNVTERFDVFIPSRIIDDSIFDELKNSLANDFLDGHLDIQFPSDLDASKKDELKKILTERDIQPHAFDIVRQLLPRDQNLIMILSGLLRHEVLKMALTKRWRVNYGVDPKGARKMAIPFKAKDVAAEMTEFGHPDVAICLTQLSYYYSGWN